MENALMVLLLSAAVLVAGCVQTPQANTSPRLSDGTIAQPDGTMIAPDGTMIEADNAMENDDSMEPSAGDSMTAESEYQPFSQAAFEAAKTSGKKIFLNFYANWCPICRVAEPKVEGGFEQCKNPNIVGFRVNYNDNEVDADELALAQAYNVTYQHTFVYLDTDGQTVLFKQTSANWNERELANQLACA